MGALNNVYIVGTGNGKSLEEFKTKLRDDIVNDSASYRSCTITTGTSPLINSGSLKTLSSSDAVVLVEEIGVSRYDDIARLKEICEKFDVKILGAVVLG